MRQEAGSWKLEVGGRRWVARGVLGAACLAAVLVLAGPGALGQNQPVPLVQAVSGGTAVPVDMMPVPRSPLAPATLPEWPKRDLTKIVISGQKLEKPDLQYHLIPRLDETQPGNAAIFYLQAQGRLPPMPNTGNGEEILSDIARTADLQALDPKDPRIVAALAQFDGALKMLRDGARCDSVDWQTPIRTQGIAALLPQLGPMRWMANVLAVQTRIAIKEHRWADAQADLQTGYMLARHMCEGDTLIEALVGVAIASLMNQCVQDWIGQPGAPNLYWPLSNLPAPFTDMRRAMAGERSFIEFSLPQFKRMRDGQFRVDDWNGMVARFQSLSGDFEADVAGTYAKDRILGPALAVALYPMAKPYLAQHGFSAEQVEKMPVVEAVGRYFVLTYDEAVDGMYKWMGLPPAQRAAGLKVWEKEFQQQKANNQGNLLAMIMLPSLGRAMDISVRLDRQIAALRIVEAIRAYAGETGALPDSLDELTLPVPTDPLGQAFIYTRTGDTAVLNSLATQNKSDMVHFALTLRK